MSAKVWCVGWLYRDEKGRLVQGPSLEWCATKNGQPFPETQNSVATLCNYFVTLPCGMELREPTCPECIAALAKRAA